MLLVNSLDGAMDIVSTDGPFGFFIIVIQFNVIDYTNNISSLLIITEHRNDTHLSGCITRMEDPDGVIVLDG